MIRAFGTPRKWWADPVVGLGAAVAIAAHAWMFFVGEYLPYIDWSNHLGLISVLAHGGDSGALAYVHREWAPTPYLLFYALTAAFAQVMAVPAAAKASLLVATGLCTYGAAYYAESGGRSPRLGLVAPLALFGFSLGYGFAAFVFAVPFMFWVLGAAERLLSAVDEGRPARRAWVTLAVAIALMYLAHALLFATVSVLVALRTSLWSLGRLRDPRQAARGFLAVGTSALPIVAIGLPFLVVAMQPGEATTAGAPPPEHWFSFTPLSQHLANLGGHLLERGSARHWLTMKAALGLFVVWSLVSAFATNPDPAGPRRGFGLEINAAALCAFYLFGPQSLDRPVEVWMVYPRFGILAAALVFCLPRPNLTGWLGTSFAVLGLGLVLHNADINRGHIERFNGWATQYDPVRAAVPPKQRVLALTIAPPGDLTHLHPALGSLYFYHLADGAAYSAFLFDNPLLVVRPRKAGRPNAPFWRNVHGFDPKVHGKDFDYLVLRGPTLTRRADASPNHEKVAAANGWTVYRTLEPTPKRDQPLPSK